MSSHIEGDSKGSLNEYYQRSIINIKDRIEEKEKEIEDRDIEQLTEYFIQDYILPNIELDTSKQNTIKKDKDRKSIQGRLHIIIGIHIILKENIEEVVGRRSNTYIDRQTNFALENNQLVIDMTIRENIDNQQLAIENEVGQIKKVIEYKNENVNSGNKKLKNEIKQYLTQKQTILQKQSSVLDEVSKSLNLNLVKEDTPVIDLEIKKQIKMVMPPQGEKQIEPKLEQETVNLVINMIQKQCRQFEITPKAFAIANC